VRLYSAKLEASLRRRVRSELRASPELWEEYRARRKTRPSRSWWWLARLFVPLALIGYFAERHDEQLPLLFLSAALYGTGTALLRAAGLIQGLWGSTDVMVLFHLPFPDAEQFRLQWRRFVLSSLWVFYLFGIVFLGAAWAAGRNPLVAAALALGQGAAVLGVAAAVALWRPRWPSQIVGLFLNVAAVTVLWAHKFTAPLLENSPGHHLLVLPGGWSVYALQKGLLGGEPAGYVAAAAGAAGIVLLLIAYRRFLASYWIREIVFAAEPSAEQIVEHRIEQGVERISEEEPGLAARPGRLEELREELRRSVPSEMELRIRDSGWQRAPSFGSGGALERAFERLLSPRERTVAEFLMGGAPLSFGRRLKATILVAAAGSGAIFLFDPVAPSIVLGLVMLGMLLGGGLWPGFTLRPCAGKFMPVLAAYPVGFTEGSSLLMKVHAVRTLLWAPAAVAVAALVGHRSEAGAAAGAIIGAKAAWAGLWLAPLFVVLRFSLGTNDTEVFSVRGCLGFLFPVLIAVAGAIGALVALLVPVPALQAAGAVALPGFLVGLWAFYGRVYTRGRIDLVRSTPVENPVS
jgi:hypothetical protein